MLGLASLLLGLLPAAAFAQDVFGLYGYGDGVDGLEVFYYNGYAYLGNVTTLSLDNSANVTFKAATDDSSTWTYTSAPNSDMSLSGYYYIPDLNETVAHKTGFVSTNSTAKDITSGFGFFGSTATWTDSTGALQTKWYAVADDAADDLYALMWQMPSEADTNILITLRKWAPPPPPREKE